MRYTYGDACCRALLNSADDPIGRRSCEPEIIKRDVETRFCLVYKPRDKLSDRADLSVAFRVRLATPPALLKQEHLNCGFGEAANR